jgi:hypothetical protein
MKRELGLEYLYNRMSRVSKEHDKAISKLKNMSGVSVLEDYGVTEENNELVPSGSPSEGGMMTREVRVSYTDLDTVLNTLTDVTSSGSPKTYIQEEDADYSAKETTVRICVDKDTL